MKYKEVYDNIFNTKMRYNVHIGDKDRYDFVIENIIQNNYKKIIDISSGRGYFIKYLKELKNDIDITSTDLKKFNNIDVKFIELNLCEKSDYQKIVEKYDHLSCMDVLEHVEEKHIEDILQFFSTLSNNFCFTIANHSDVQNGVELHLIQKNMNWWNDVLNRNFIIIKSFSKYNNRLYCYVLRGK